MYLGYLSIARLYYSEHLYSLSSLGQVFIYFSVDSRIMIPSIHFTERDLSLHAYYPLVDNKLIYEPEHINHINSLITLM